MKILRENLIIILLPLMFSFPHTLISQTSNRFILKKGEIHYYSEDCVKKLSIIGFVKNIFQSGKEIYYLKSNSKDDETYFIGYRNLETSKSLESKLEIDL